MGAIDYTPPQTCARFMISDSFGRIIAGPVGSGKTTACIFELLRRSCEQAPSPDGKRYTRWAIVRQTLKQIKDTVLKDIMSWLEGIAHYKVSDSTIYFDFGDVKSEWILIPLENPEDQRRLLSMQLTGAWMSEAIEMDTALLDPLSGRCGRYPSALMGGCTWFGIIADTNLPDEGSDWYKIMESDTPPDFQIFIQPGGLSPNAENLEWLLQTTETMRLTTDDPRRRAQGRTYYERLARSTQGQNWINRYVHAKYGEDPSGSAVFRTSFRVTFHVVTESGPGVLDALTPVSGHPLLIGQDFGRDPWSIIGQLDHKGRMLILQEVSAEDVGLELHVTTALRPALMDMRYLGKPICLIGDPAGVQKSTLYEETSFDLLKRLGFAAVPAPTNDIDPRIRAVEYFLLGQRDGGPAMLIDRQRCPTLIRALSGGYRYEKTRLGVRKPAPSKNQWSHPADALQYLCLATHGGMTNMIMQRIRPGVTRARPPMGSAGWT